MKKILTSFALAVGALTSAFAETSVGVSVGIDQPGFYGRIEVGNRPPPPVVYSQPVVIVNTPVAVHRRPIYMHVPPGHQKNWAKHCHRYDACGQPVYFVREEWVQEHRHSQSAPHAHAVRHHADGHGSKHGHPGRGDGPGKRHSDGHGRGNGR